LGKPRARSVFTLRGGSFIEEIVRAAIIVAIVTVLSLFLAAAVLLPRAGETPGGQITPTTTPVSSPTTTSTTTTHTTTTTPPTTTPVTYRGGPIHIQNDDQFTAANGVVSGSGTQADPYIIEGWAIDASSAHGIWIRNTTKYFVIRNCLVENGENSYYGIYLDNVINGKIENNACSNNFDGIHLHYYSSNNTLSNNACQNNSRYGIDLDHSSSNTLSNNTCENNYYDGINLFSSNNNTLFNNTCSNNSEGIYLFSSYDNLTSNTCENNYYGIYLYDSSDYNILVNNTCSNNYYGVYLRSLPKQNPFTMEIELISPNSNTIFHNHLLNNTQNNAYDEGINYWDNNGKGNYWSDWQPPQYPENDNTGIISVPRPIAGGSNYDYYPLVLPAVITTTTTTTPPENQGRPSENLEIHFIDVGQGDAIYIRTPDGADVLVDGGKKDAGATVVAYLGALGVDDIELMVATHPDSDHIGGLIAVLNAYAVEEVWESGFASGTSTYEDYRAAVEAEGCPVMHPHRGEATEIDPYLQVEILNPPDTLYSGTNTSNRNSVAMRITFGGFSVLLTGDIDKGVEGDILDDGFQVSSMVLKVAHHGSTYSSSPEFLEAVGPEVAVICVGASNTYGHPADETLAALGSVGAEIYRTDLNGTVVIKTDGTAYAVSPQKQPPTATTTTTITTSTTTTTPTTTTTTIPTTTTTTPQVEGVVISYVHYDAEGNDWDNLNDEYVVVGNNGSIDADMTGWTLRDVANHVYTFPSGFTLAAEASVTIYTGSGTNTSDHLYWGSGAPIWNNDHDTAYLRDGNGDLVDSYSW
jgi:parallel beta-helix repeat protein